MTGTQDREFVHSRLIAAPPARVFRAIAEARHLCPDANEQNLDRLAAEVRNVREVS